MKSLICSIALLLSAFVLQAQTTYPIRQNIGAATTLVKTPDYGGLQAGIIPYSFADTTAANTALTYLKWYCGAEIYTTDVAARWYRSCYGGGYRWVMISPSGAPSSSNSYLLYGNAGLFTAASGDIPLGFTVPNYGIDFTTNNTSRVILDRTGLSLLSSISDTTDNKVMTYNTSTRKWNYGYWFGSGGGGTGWNILGNAGTTAGTNFIGTTDNIDLVFKRNSVESGRFSASGNLNLGLTGTTLGSLGLSGNTSGLITIKGQAAAGTYNFNLPTTAGTSTYFLTSAGGVGSPMTWTDPTSLGYWKLASGGTLTGLNTITQAGNAFEMSGGSINLGGSDYQVNLVPSNSFVGLGDPSGGGNNNYITIYNDNGINERVEINADSTFIKGLDNLTSQTRIIGQDGSTDRLGYLTVGSGLSISGGALTATGSGGTVTSIATTSPITGGTITTTGTIACATCVTSAASLTNNSLVIGGGSQATSTTTTGTGVLTALGVNVGTAGAFVVNGGALGTPSSGTLTNATGLPEGGLSMTDITTNNTSTTQHGFFPKLTTNTVYYVSNAGALTALALGANGTVLTSNGATSAPTFSAAAGGVTIAQVMAASYYNF